jgi:hypothetical protein
MFSLGDRLCKLLRTIIARRIQPEMLSYAVAAWVPSPVRSRIVACAAASLAIGTRYGLQDT